jgi:uncharacterized membrane protein YfcA
MLYVNAVVCLAATLQGVTGFGFMMLAVPGLILGFPAQVLVPALIMMWLPLGTAQALQLWRDVDWGRLAYLVASATLALPAGAIALETVDTETMQRGIGAMMVCLAVLLQINPGRPFQRERPARVGAGLISGVLASSTSVSGPPVVLLGLKQRWPSAQFRATLLTYFLGVSLLCLPFHWSVGLVNRSSIGLAATGLPGLIVGFVAGTWLRGRVEGRAFRWVAIGMVLGGGLAAILL